MRKIEPITYPVQRIVRKDFSFNLEFIDKTFDCDPDILMLRVQIGRDWPVFTVYRINPTISALIDILRATADAIEKGPPDAQKV